MMIYEELAAQIVDMLQALLDRRSLPIHGHLVVSIEAALRACAVVADDVEDSRIFVMSLSLDRVERASDLIIGLHQKTGIDFHLPRDQPLLIGAQRIPGRDFLGSRSQLRVGGDYSQFFLTSKRFRAQLVPTLFKLAAILGDPFSRT
jgi:hypothetical protein